MKLRLSAHRTPDEQRSGAARDLHGERRRYRRRRDRAQTRAGRLERELAGDAARHEQGEAFEGATVEERGADHFVHRVMAANVFGVVKELLTVGERGGMDAPSV